jgi:hypothetical protein
MNVSRILTLSRLPTLIEILRYEEPSSPAESQKCLNPDDLVCATRSMVNVTERYADRLLEMEANNFPRARAHKLSGTRVTYTQALDMSLFLL